MTDRELDAAVASEVFGWKRVDSDEPLLLSERGGFIDVFGCPSNYFGEATPMCQFTPSTDANDDYRVLCFVREKWSGHEAIAFHRRLNVHLTDKWKHIVPSQYRIGDYSRAALAVVRSASPIPTPDEAEQA